MSPATVHGPSDFYVTYAAGEPELRASLRLLYGPVGERALDELFRSAVLLEVLAVAACLLEAQDEAEADPTSEDLRSRVQRRCGLDAVAVLREAEDQFGIAHKPPTPMLTTAIMVREARSILEVCPIAELESLATEVHLDPFGHRCRLAFAALRGFVQRNDTARGRTLRRLGQRYTEGKLSIDDVAEVIQESRADAVAMLEELGFQRPLEVIRLSDDARAERLAAIRADRLRRDGVTPLIPDLVARDVIASERIEGVDARPWL